MLIPALFLRLALWLLLAPLLPGIINKVKSWVAGRRGLTRRAELGAAHAVGGQRILRPGTGRLGKSSAGRCIRAACLSGQQLPIILFI